MPSLELACGGLGQAPQLVCISGDQCDGEWGIGKVRVAFPPVRRDVVDCDRPVRVGPRRSGCVGRRLHEVPETDHDFSAVLSFDDEEPFAQREIAAVGGPGVGPSAL